MNYSLEKISTVATCDALLALAQTKKQVLERKRRNLGESITNFGERIDHIGNELASVLLLLQTFATAYDALPEGSMDKVNINVEVKRMEVRKAQLDRLAMSCNIHSILTKQVHYNRLDSQVSLIDTYITALQNKRTALEHATLHADVGTFRPKTGRPPLHTTSFRRAQGVRQKLQPEKRSYNVHGHFFNLSVVHLKQQLEKRVYSFRTRLSERYLKPAVMYWLQILRKNTGSPSGDFTCSVLLLWVIKMT